MNLSDWTTEETTLLIRKRLEMFGCTRSDKVYDQISDYLYRKYNICQNPSSCQSRFNNVLKTYRSCVKRLADDGSRIRKMRFLFFDLFHQHYANTADKDQGSGKCKSEIFLDTIFQDSSYGEVGDSMTMDSRQTGDGHELTFDGDAELTTSLAVNHGLDDLKLRLMEQKLLFYTNQNMLLRDQQEHCRQEDQDRTGGQLADEEIPKVLRGIHSCLSKTLEIKIVPTPSKRVVENVAPVELGKQPKNRKNMKETEGSSLAIPIEVESDEAINDGAKSSEQVVKKQEMSGLKVRKNIFPAWNRIQTVLLIKIHCDLRPKFKGFNLFECISNKLIELHINRTPRDCRTRWNNLFRSYKECRSRLRLNDKAVVKFEYFDEIDAYYKDQQFLSI